jgi:hypothetical protein
MSYKPIQTKKFKKFLKNRGLVYIRNHGDHEIWDYLDNSILLKPVTFIGCDKEIPAFHIRTNLKTLNIKYSEFEKEISKF